MSQLAKHRNNLGIWRATSLVTGNIVGSGLFLLPASLAIYGTMGLLGWTLTSVGSIFLALVFARLSKDFPKIGGPYAYSREAFGDFVGFQMAWSYWVGTWASNAAIAIALVSYLSNFWPELGVNTPLAFLVALSTVWFFTFVNIVGVKTAGTVQLITTLLKIIPFIAISIFGLPQINIEHFTPINPSGVSTWTALSTSAALTLFTFLGLESATIPADDVENPERTIPLATVLGTLLAALIYIGMMFVLLGMIPPYELSSSLAPFADAAQVIFGSGGYTVTIGGTILVFNAKNIIAAAAVISILGTLNGWILVQGQIPVAAARDGLFPSFFARLSQSGTPYIGLVISAALMSVMLMMNYEADLVEQFTLIVTFTTFAVLLPYLYSTVAELYFLLSKPTKLPKGKFIRSSIIALIAFFYTILITAGAGQNAVYLGMLFVFSGFPFYVWMKRHRPKKRLKIS